MRFDNSDWNDYKNVDGMQPSPPPSRDLMISALRAAGRRITAQRLAIIDSLEGRTDHPSARRLFDDLRRSGSPPSLGTVYNTLTALVDAGALREIDFQSTDTRYDPNLHPHLNLVCNRCGSITDLEHDAPLPPEEIFRRTGFTVRELRLEYRGLCPACLPSIRSSSATSRGDPA